MDAARVDQVLQFALGVASEQERGRDALSLTYLLKLVYLADLTYAARHEGETLTGAPWRLHHFGPYTEVVQDRLRETLVRLRAMEVPLPARAGSDDRCIYRLNDPDAFAAAERALPGEVAVVLRRALREHGCNTPSLLHEVYKTPPMEGAAPGSQLDFHRAVRAPLPPDEPAPERSTRQKKKFAERAAALRAKLAEAEKARALKPPIVPKPRYDDVFVEGTAWLDELAGEPLEPFDGIATIDPSVWQHRGGDGKGVA